MPTLPTPAAMLARFSAAGLTPPCVWAPQPSGALVSAAVDFRDPTLQLLGDEGAISVQPTALWPRGQYPGAKRGDKLTVTHPHTGQPVAYAITELHRAGTDGDEILAELEIWPTP